MDLIKKECAIDGPEACCRHVLKDWLNGQGAYAYQPPTWPNLIKILEAMEETRLVGRLQTYLSAGPD